MNTSERDFLLLIKEAIFANPFSMTRLQLDLSAVQEHSFPVDVSKDEILQTLVDKVERILLQIKKRKGASLSRFNAEERELYQLGNLFFIFHSYMEQFDTYIRSQVEAGNRLVPVLFGKEVVGLIVAAGFSESDAKRYFSLFFQMRRAHYFISRISGESDSMCQLRSRLWNNIFSANIGLYNTYLWDRMEDFSTLLLGETGTGKGMAAAAIGRSGYIPFDGKENFSESFVSAFTEINLSQYSGELIESELFGHKKGAFTGAVDNHFGLLAHCSPCGSVFLDEIGDVSIQVQIKLLRVLQERGFYPVGSHKEERFSGRVIAATHQNLDTLRQEKKFRDDFYYRLCSDRIEIPPLRMRLSEDAAELGRLVRVVIRRLVGSDSGELAADVEEWITTHQPERYQWPGNIRELEQCIRQYLLTNQYHWQGDTSSTPSSSLANDIEAGRLSAGELQERYCRLLYKHHKTYEAVGRVAGLDRRTVKKYIDGLQS